MWASIERQEASMTPEEKAKFVELFSGPRRFGRDRFSGRLMDLVQHEDGSITFVPNEFDAEMDRILTNAIDQIFGPKPAEDD
jgi:hypothetical protein